MIRLIFLKQILREKLLRQKLKKKKMKKNFAILKMLDNMKECRR